MTRAVFIACNAYDWDPTDLKNATFSIEEGGPRIAIDSTLRPRSGQTLEGAVLDDHASSGGATSVLAKGDDGGLYVEEVYALNHRLPSIPPGYEAYADRPYEFRTVQYSNKDGKYPGRRYYGFHAIWLDGPPKRANIIIFNAGESKATWPSSVIRRTVTLADEKMFLPADEIGYLHPAAGDTSGGCLFIRCGEASNWLLRIPKLPQAMGVSLEATAKPDKITRTLSCPKLDQ
jgi:hypothetical protein